MPKLINKLIRYILPDQKLWEIKNSHNVPSMEWSLMNIKKLGYSPQFAIDAGACDGDWTTMLKKIFPSSKVLMIEARPEKAAALKAVTCKISGTSFYIGTLGAVKDKEVIFYVNSTVSSVLEEYKANDFKKEKHLLQTLDDIVFTETDMLPDLLKLDVQGYELEILKGSPKVLLSIQFILCEVSLIEINKGAPLIADVIRFLDDNGFVAYDICSFIRRPLDKALWQTDLLFIRKTHPLIKNKYWN